MSTAAAEATRPSNTPDVSNPENSARGPVLHRLLEKELVESDTTSSITPCVSSNCKSSHNGCDPHGAVEVTPVLCFPVVTSPASAFPAKSGVHTEWTPFTHPSPVIMTGPRAWARIIKARNQLIITDEDLVELAGTIIDTINKTVLRNACLFPKSYCFRLSAQEWHQIKSKINHMEVDRGQWLTSPLAFTAEGVLALSKALDTFEATRASVIVWRAVRGLETACKGN